MAEANDAAAVARIYVDSWNLGFAGLMPERRVDLELSSLGKGYCRTFSPPMVDS